MNTVSTTPRAARARRRIVLAAGVTAAGLLLAACGGGGGMSGMDHGDGGKKSAAPSSSAAPAGENPAPGAFNDADVMFAQMMIPHHEQALEMSALADGRAKDPEVVKLAAEIAGAQDPEIRKMTSWLGAWGKPVSAGDAHAGHGSEGSGKPAMAGMMTEKDMAELRSAEGVEFDRAFARLMVAHHKGAVEMAEEERKNGRNATARKLADEVIANQSAEIAAFEKILARL
ncbi:DUF305 domain-containing protein [Streptomyces sp. CAU 1734]|uniref:DUF305 domain-containing protein n=1 Tax=Streptomyces sp. CAU 1734 TaxID=3140360 RepID=UPI00326116E5